MIKAIKQILALGFGCYWVYTGSTGGDVLKAIMGGVLLCWGILDFLSEWRHLYGTIRNVLGSAVGAIIIAYGIVLFVQFHNDWTFALFILLGLAVLLTDLIPIISEFRFRKILKMSNSYQARHTYVTKVCPRGHGYKEIEHSCPFCGEKDVASTVEVAVAPTLFYTDIGFEMNGIKKHVCKAVVDGIDIDGNISLRVYHTLSYRYKYGVTNGAGMEMVVTPNSIVTLSGENFSKIFSGREFFEMCDRIFDNNQMQK